MNNIDQNSFMDDAAMAFKQGMYDLLKYALIVVATAPIICVYPFIQKYFMEIDTAFDMASVTKVIGTTMCAARLAERGPLDWNTALSEFSEDPGNFGDVTITEMMSHQAGFVRHAIKPFSLAKPEDELPVIFHSAPAYKKRTRAVFLYDPPPE
jgi:CubicO group peptidase (beta-lactamase class C family)